MDSAVVERYTVADSEPHERYSALAADLLAVVARLDRFVAQRIPASLPPAQARMLAGIEAHAEARICELAAIDHCSQPTMTTQVSKFEEAGLVTRVLDSRDARAVRVRITAKGIRALNAVRRDHTAAIEPTLALLEPAERQLLADAVEVLQRFLEVPMATPRRNGRASAPRINRPHSTGIV